MIDSKEEWDRMVTLFFRLEALDRERATKLTMEAIERGWPYSMSGLGFGPFKEATLPMRRQGSRILKILEKIPVLHLQPLGSEVHRKRECLRLNIPASVVNGTDFHEWLNKAAGEDDSVANTATWHRPGRIGEYSDVFVHVCDTDGSNSDMPLGWWEAILSHTGGFYEGLVWISFEE